MPEEPPVPIKRITPARLPSLNDARNLPRLRTIVPNLTSASVVRESRCFVVGFQGVLPHETCWNLIEQHAEETNGKKILFLSLEWN